MNNNLSDITRDFLKYVGEFNPRQKSSIEDTIDRYFEKSDYSQLDEIIRFYNQKNTIYEIANAYNLVIEDTATETKFFLENGRYRYSSFEETEKLVYSNQDYMEKYMIGLAISGYLWSNHIKIFHWFSSMMSVHAGKMYLEIGPGHGRYFCEAAQKNRFESYHAIDISDTSVKQTTDFIDFFLNDNIRKKCNVFKQDAYNYCPENKYDFVVIAEVLEHLEAPDLLLKKISSFSNDEAYLYLTVPVNAPAIDHIYLFNSIKEVEEMVEDAGYGIIDHLYAPAADMELQRAIKRKNAIVVGLLARKGPL